MKETIKNLQKLLCFSSQEALSEFLGISQPTLYREKQGFKTRQHGNLLMLEWLLFELSEDQLAEFRYKFRVLHSKMKTVTLKQFHSINQNTRDKK